MVGPTVILLLEVSSLFSPVDSNGGKILQICACLVAEINMLAAECHHCKDRPLD